MTGVTTVKLGLKSGAGETINCIVYHQLSDGSLMSWYTQKRLGILHEEWPHEYLKAHQMPLNWKEAIARETKKLI